MAIVVKSMATSDVEGFMVEVEASTIKGQQQGMSIIGLPDQAIKEAGERIQAAIESCGYDIQRNDSFIMDVAERILSEAEGAGMDIVTYEDIRYPKRFKGIADVPVLLYVKGELRINEYADSVGIVGARRCSHEGKERAIIAAERAVSENKAVISGMAKGIDSYAHTATIKGNGYTIAVLGSGADICYPKEHEKLYEEIIKTGCVLSEYPPETTPKTFYFPMRNRLIAALSDKLFVIDAGRNSGTRSRLTR